MEEEEETKKHKVLVKKPLHPQGDVISVTFSLQNIMRTAVAQVSDRVLPETIKLSLYPPVYNDLTKEVKLWYQQCYLYTVLVFINTLNEVKSLGLLLSFVLSFFFITFCFIYFYLPIFHFISVLV